MNRLINYFFSEYHFKIQTTWFKRSLYLFVILKTIYWLSYFDLYFGVNSIIYPSFRSVSPLNDLAFLLSERQNSLMNLFVLVTLLVLALGRLLIQKTTFIYTFCIDLLIWFLVINTHNLLYSTLSGGSFLLNQFLLFNCFLSGNCQTATYSAHNASKEQLRSMLHNVAAIGVIVQIMLLYFLSGLAKLFDHDWLSGEALNFTFQIRHFSKFDVNTDGTFWYLVTVVLNYTALIYQLGFPFLVWVKKIKKPYLLFGILMHLFIAFFIGLPEFGTIMLIAYIYFWPFKNRVS